MLHWWLESPPASNRVGDRNEGWKTDGAPASTRLPSPGRPQACQTTITVAMATAIRHSSSGFHPRLPLFRQRRQCVVKSDLRQGGARRQESLEQVGGCAGFAQSAPPSLADRGGVVDRGRTEPGDLRQVSQEKKMWLPIEKIAVVPIPSDAHSRHRHDNPHPGQQHEDIETDRITRGHMNFCVPGAHLSTRNVLERTTGISAASYTDRCHMHRTEHCSEYVLCTDRREPQRRRSSAGPGAVRCTGHGTAVR